MSMAFSRIKETATRMAEECQIKHPEVLPLFKFLYQPKPDSPIEKTLSGAERVTHLRREQLLCLLVAILGAFFLISWAPQLAAQMMGVAYPLYATVYTVRGYSPENAETLKSWLVYWAVYGAFSLLDSLLLPVLMNVTAYWLAKIAFLFYLVCTQPLGATELLEKGLYPAVDRIDMFFSKLFDGTTLASSPKQRNGKKK